MTDRAQHITAQQCPRPANAVPGYIVNWTVLDCLDCDECGCELGDAVRAASGEDKTS